MKLLFQQYQEENRIQLSEQNLDRPHINWFFLLIVLPSEIGTELGKNTWWVKSNHIIEKSISYISPTRIHLRKLFVALLKNDIRIFIYVYS